MKIDFLKKKIEKLDDQLEKAKEEIKEDDKYRHLLNDLFKKRNNR